MKYEIINQRYNLVTVLKQKDAKYLSKIKVSYMIEVIIDENTLFLIATYDKLKGIEYITLEDIFEYKLATYHIMSGRVLTSKYRLHPFYNEIKSNLKDSYIKFFKYEEKIYDFNKEKLIDLLKNEFPANLVDKLKLYGNDIFFKNKLPVEVNHKGNISEIKEDTNLVEFIERYAFGHRQLMLFGEKGTGKTYAIRQFVDKNNWQLVKIDGHAGLDEYSLLGHLIRTEDGSFSWKNGSLAQAFREATLGNRVVVFIDEILRMSPQTLNLLITVMDPYNGYYELELDSPIKDEVNGSIKTETLKAPVQNIWFICATNIGANYEVSAMDEAFKDRFILKEMKLTLEEMSKIITLKLKEKEVAYSTKKIMVFYGKMHNLYLSKMISSDINLRHITDVIEYASKGADLKILFKDKVFAWAGLNYNGEPVQDEINIINKAIDALL